MCINQANFDFKAALDDMPTSTSYNDSMQEMCWNVNSKPCMFNNCRQYWAIWDLLGVSTDMLLTVS